MSKSKDIPNYPGYAATENGDIYRTSYDDNGNKSLRETPHKLAPSYDKDGYLKVVLSIGNKLFYKRVHRLVAITFLPNENNYPLVNHKNGNKKDNRIANLEWVSHRENVNHAHRTGLHKGCRTRVRLTNGSERKEFSSVVEAADYLGHARDCFRRHLVEDSRHGHIDGWGFELIGGKNRRKVIPV